MAISYAGLCFSLEKKRSEKLLNETSVIIGKLSIISFDDSQSALYGKTRGTKVENSGMSFLCVKTCLRISTTRF